MAPRGKVRIHYQRPDNQYFVRTAVVERNRLVNKKDGLNHSLMHEPVVHMGGKPLPLVSWNEFLRSEDPTIPQKDYESVAFYEMSSVMPIPYAGETVDPKEIIRERQTGWQEDLQVNGLAKAAKDNNREVGMAILVITGGIAGVMTILMAILVIAGLSGGK